MKRVLLRHRLKVGHELGVPSLSSLFYTSSSQSYNYTITNSTQRRGQCFVSYKSNYKHLFPCYFNDDKLVVDEHLEDNKPHYDNFDDLNHHNSILVTQGRHFDLISLLSTYSDHLIRVHPNNNNKTDFVKANYLRGKYVLLCCLFLPALSNKSQFLRKLSLLSSELSQTHIASLFEIVIVSKMRKGWDDDEAVFHHSLSAFSGCLAVPFTHKSRRDYLCKSLNLDAQWRYILFDHSHKVLLDDYESIFRFGARGFPFTDAHISSIDDEDDWGEPCHPSNKTLVGLLSCELNSSSFLLHKFDSKETISVAQLNKHLVGLYLFREGSRMKTFHDIYQQCRDQGLDFEIVLVSLPFHYSMHPKDFQDFVHSAMKELRVSNWWLFPFNNSACLRLDHLSNIYARESLIIVGPHNNYVDSQGGDVVFLYGSHFGTQMYPFTLEALLQTFLQRLESITLDSVLTCAYVYRDYECDNGKIMPLSDLKGKNVLFYVDHATCLKLPWELVCREVAWWFDIIKEKDSNFEVVFVPIINSIPANEYPTHVSKVRECIFQSKTKFLVCPFADPEHSRYLRNHDAFMFSQKSCGSYSPEKGLPVPSVLAFGKDGHLHALDALRLLRNLGLDAYPFLLESRNLNLRNDITHLLCDEFDIMEDSTISL